MVLGLSLATQFCRFDHTALHKILRRGVLTRLSWRWSKLRFTAFTHLTKTQWFAVHNQVHLARFYHRKVNLLIQTTFYHSCPEWFGLATVWRFGCCLWLRRQHLDFLWPSSATLRPFHPQPASAKDSCLRKRCLSSSDYCCIGPSGIHLVRDSYSRHDCCSFGKDVDYLLLFWGFICCRLNLPRFLAYLRDLFRWFRVW